MADEADSKSVVGNHVRVQVPLPASKFSALSFTAQGFSIAQWSVLLCSLAERQDRIRRRNLAAVIQMGADVGNCSNIAVPQPFLDFLQADAICVKQADAAGTRRSEPYFRLFGQHGLHILYADVSSGAAAAKWSFRMFSWRVFSCVCTGS